MATAKGKRGGATRTDGIYDAATPTKSDTVDEPNGPFRGIMVGAVGDVKITTLGGSDVVLPNLVAGVWHAQPGTRIWSTGTEPTEILVGY